MSFSSFLFAIEFCDDLDPFMNEGYGKEVVMSSLEQDRRNHYANECFSEGGEGSHFTYTGTWVSECGGRTSKNGFWKSNATCDFCDGFAVTLELEITKNACHEDCRESNLTCQHPSFPNLWGGDIVKINPNEGACGAPLPGCAESSSSSAFSSSSFAESSDSDEESSSNDVNTLIFVLV